MYTQVSFHQKKKKKCLGTPWASAQICRSDLYASLNSLCVPELRTSVHIQLLAGGFYIPCGSQCVCSRSSVCNVMPAWQGWGCMCYCTCLCLLLYTPLCTHVQQYVHRHEHFCVSYAVSTHSSSQHILPSWPPGADTCPLPENLCAVSLGDSGGSGGRKLGL